MHARAHCNKRNAYMGVVGNRYKRSSFIQNSAFCLASSYRYNRFIAIGEITIPDTRGNVLLLIIRDFIAITDKSFLAVTL